MFRVALLLPLLLCSVACQKNEFGPITTPAAQHPAYARLYPAELAETLALYDAEHKEAKDVPSQLAHFPGKLKDPKWSNVSDVYRLAEADGKSAHYARIKRNNTEVARFFVDERKEVVQHVNGGVQYQAKQEHCRSKFYSAIDQGLESAVSQRFESRQDAQTQSLLYINEYEDALGKDNLEQLRLQSKAIASASHLVNVVLAKRHLQIKQQVQEASSVEKTLAARLDELESVRSDKESEKEKKARDDEHSQIFTARVELDNVVKKAKQRLKTSENEVTEARRTYAEAMRILLEQIDKKDAPEAQK